MHAPLRTGPMDQDDRKAFASTMTGLAEVYGRDLSTTALNGYWSALKGYTLQQFQTAAAQSIAMNRFMPLPVDLIQLIEGNPEDLAELAWMTALRCAETVGSYKSVAFEDQRIMTALEACGGYHQLCRTESTQLHWFARDFRKAYTATLSGGPRASRSYIPGLTEMGNKRNGINKIEPVHLISSTEQGDTVLDSPALLDSSPDALSGPLSHDLKRIGQDQG